MENLQKIYDLNIDNILGGNIDYLKNFRQELIKDFNLDNKYLKSNESTKYIDQNFLKKLNFKYTNVNTKYQYLTDHTLNSSINVKNGSNYILTNFQNKKAIIEPLSSDFDSLINRLEKNKNQFRNDYIANFNSILLNSGFYFTLNENNNYKISLIHSNDEPNTTVYAKNIFNIKKNSKLILIENFINKVPSNLNIINYFELEEGSEVTHLVIQNNTNGTNLQFTTHSNCHQFAKFNQLIFNCSDTSGRNHHYVTLNGENSEANLKGIFFAKDKQIIDNKTEISHINPNCISNQVYKGILTDSAKASYLSKTFVDRLAQKTDGYQLSKGILLSDDAYFHSKPELKIYADDVKCSHGSTIGPFDKEEIFYLRSRGLAENTAKSLLIKSFYRDLLSAINEKPFLNKVDEIVDSWLLQKIH